MRFVAAVKNSLQHRRVTRDGLILASVLRWQEDRGLMLLDPCLSQNIADSYYSTNTLGVTTARPAAVTPEPPGAPRSDRSSATTGKRSSHKNKWHDTEPRARSSRQHLARGAAAGAGSRSQLPASSPNAGTPSSASGSSMAEDEPIIDILDPESRLKEHRAAVLALAAKAALNTSMSSDESDAFQAPVANFGVNLDSEDEL